MRSLKLITCMAVAALSLAVQPAAATTLEGDYLVANPTRGYGLVRNLPNPFGALETNAAYGGYSFSDEVLTSKPIRFRIVDANTGVGGHSYTVCQGSCETGTRIAGCTPDNGTVQIGSFNFTTDEDIIVFVYGWDPALEACSNIAVSGTVRLVLQ